MSTRDKIAATAFVLFVAAWLISCFVLIGTFGIPGN